MRLTCGNAWLDVASVGAMITQAQLCVNGQAIRPFFDNPWQHDPRPMDTLTRHLGVEWPCVPFGVPEPPGNLPSSWLVAEDTATWNKHAHGYGAHNQWKLTRQDNQTLSADISYPDASPIARVRRRVTLASERDIHLRLEVSARASVTLPLGVHPVFSLVDAKVGAVTIELPGDESAWTFPIDVEPGQSRLQPDQRGCPLSALRTSSGDVTDARKLPFPGKSEDLILLPNAAGSISLLRPESGYRATLRWNADDLPACLLWISNRGRDYAPWDGRVSAVGIEPIAGAFDLGVAHSASLNTPLALSNISTAVQIKQDETWHTEYSISLEGLSSV
jgi:hypothetical protein